MASTVDTDRHRARWNNPSVVSGYARAEHLQPPERTLLDHLAPGLADMRMLDIGIGGGRTTLHFLPRVAQYTGIDLSPEMVAVCEQRFADHRPEARFAAMDARDLGALPTDGYDLVLFSYNGIDCLDTTDRERVLQEMARVAAPGAHVVFSSHNLLYLKRMYALRRRPTWREFLYQFYRTARLYYHNGPPGRYRTRDLAVIRDGHEHFHLDVLYCHPLRQRERLQQLGFRDVRLFTYRTGQEVDAHREETMRNEPWVYFHCRA